VGKAFTLLLAAAFADELALPAVVTTALLAAGAALPETAALAGAEVAAELGCVAAEVAATLLFDDVAAGACACELSTAILCG
jgi:hypothetical protein